MSYDLNELLSITDRTEEGVWVELKHPEAPDEVAFKVKVRSSDSKFVQDAILVVLGQQAERAQMSKDKQHSFQGGVNTLEQRKAKFIAAIADVDGLTNDGAPVKCDDQLREFIYQCPPFRNQISEVLQTNEVFIKA